VHAINTDRRHPVAGRTGAETNGRNHTTVAGQNW
jgi:hypothetical protein